MAVVFAVHAFEAENPDEISFAIGEKVTVLERDDQYGDGWWQGKNERGEIGLFPQSYTSQTPPEPEHEAMAATMTDIDQAISSLGSTAPTRAPAVADTSARSDDEDVAAAPVSRSALAAKAHTELARLAEKKRQETEDLRAPPVAGLELSDESDEEEGLSVPASHGLGGVAAPLALPIVSRSPFGASTSSRMSALASRSPQPPTAVEDDDEEPRSAFVPVDEPEPQLRSSQFFGRAAETAPAASIPVTAVSAPSTPPVIEQAHYFRRSVQNARSNGSLSSAAAADPTIVPTLANLSVADQDRSFTTPEPGAAAARPPSVRSILTSSSTQPAPSPVATPAPSTAATAAPTTNGVHPQAVAAVASQARSLGQPAPAPQPILQQAPAAPIAAVTAPREVSPPPISPARSRPSTGNAFAGAQAPGVAAEIAPRSPTTSQPIAAVQPTAPTPRPADPREWTVEHVQEWGRERSFDNHTLSKLQEHEISGDILLEMDVNSLKEIELPAFGRRVHVYNGIKQLRKQVEAIDAPSGGPAPAHANNFSTGQAAVSPTASSSGYQPDTPTSAFSPNEVYHTPALITRDSYQYQARPSFASTADSFAASTADSSYDMREMQTTQSAHGLGLGGQAAIAGLAGVAGAGMARAATHSGAPVHEIDSSDQDGDITQSTMPDGFESDAGRSSVMGRIRQKTGSIRSGVTRSNRVSGSAQSETENALSAPSSPDISKRGSSYKPDRASKSFFATTLRGRKPPPRASISDINSLSAPSSGSSTKRMTRILPGFGGAAVTSPPLQTSQSLKSSISTPLEAGPPKESSDAGTSTPRLGATRTLPIAIPEEQEKESGPKTGDAVSQIGIPDYAGWLSKKGDGLNTWKQRWVILKGNHIYWLKTPDEAKVKGWVDLLGYKVLPDSDTARNRYGFKLVHSQNAKAPHHFSADDPLRIRKWMKQLMKQTISRDYTQAVTSSSTIPTIPLAEAQAMFPPPRPPSPQSRARAQRARLADSNPNSLTPKDAAVLMSLQKPPSTPTSTSGPPARSKKRISTAPSVQSTQSFVDVPEPPGLSPATSPNTEGFGRPRRASQRSTLSPRLDGEEGELMRWVNDHLPQGTGKASSFSTSFRSGRLLLRLIEHNSGKSYNMPDSRFGVKGSAPEGDDEPHIDVLLDIYDIILELRIEYLNVSAGEVMRGDAGQTQKLVGSIRRHFS